MTVSSTSSKTVAYGNGVTTAFPYAFLIPNAASLVVTYVNEDGEETVIPAGQYSVSGLGVAAGGTVTYPLSGSPIADGTSLTIERVLPLTQLTRLRNQGGYYPEVVEAALDNLLMLIQQVAGGAQNYPLALLFPTVDEDPDTQLPPAAQRADKFLAFDTDGNPIVLPATGAPTDLSPYFAEGTGTDTPRTLASRFADVFNVMDFGASGNGATDDTDEIQAAADAATAAASGSGLSNVRRKVLYFPSGYTFLVNPLGIEVGQNVDVLMDSPLIVSAAAGLAVHGLLIGGADMTRHGRYILDVRRQTQSSWGSTSDVGVTLKNIVVSEILVKRSQGFCVGVQGLGASNGFALNRIYVGEVRGSKYGVELTNTGTGYANANNIYGGEIACSTGEGQNGSSRYGIHIGGTNGNNSNTIIGTSFELNLTLAQTGNPSAEAVPVLISNASNLNRGVALRSEGNSDTLLKITADGFDNFFASSYTARQSAWPSVINAGISDASKYQTNVVYSHVDDLMRRAYQVFDSGTLGQKTNQYNGTSYTVDGFDIADSSFNLAAANTLIAPSNDDVLAISSSGRNLVRWLDTRVNKRFMVFFDTASLGSFQTNFAVKPYDAGLALLDDNPSPAHVYGEDANVFGWNGASLNGAYVSTGSSTFARIYFTVDSLTKFAAFCFVGANGQQLKSLRIYALDYPSTSWQLMREREFEGRMIGTAIPTADSWTRGDRVYNHTPSAAGTEGWICTVSGTFGALVGVTATTVNTSLEVALNSATNVTTGMYITIAGVSGVKRVTGKSGNNITIDVAADATVAGAAVAYQAPTFKTFGTIAA